jgi:hypothetical protein
MGPAQRRFSYARNLCDVAPNVAPDPSEELYDKGGELALQEISRRKPVLKNRTAPQIERAVVDLAIEQPAWGQVRVSEALTRQGLSISPAGCAACGSATI